jgi:hypothetical protein
METPRRSRWPARCRPPHEPAPPRPRRACCRLPNRCQSSCRRPPCAARPLAVAGGWWARRGHRRTINTASLTVRARGCPESKVAHEACDATATVPPPPSMTPSKPGTAGVRGRGSTFPHPAPSCCQAQVAPTAVYIPYRRPAPRQPRPTDSSLHCRNPQLLPPPPLRRRCIASPPSLPQSPRPTTLDPVVTSSLSLDQNTRHTSKFQSNGTSPAAEGGISAGNGRPTAPDCERPWQRDLQQLPPATQVERVRQRLLATVRRQGFLVRHQRHSEAIQQGAQCVTHPASSRVMAHTLTGILKPGVAMGWKRLRLRRLRARPDEGGAGDVLAVHTRER